MKKHITIVLSKEDVKTLEKAVNILENIDKSALWSNNEIRELTFDDLTETKVVRNVTIKYENFKGV